MIRVIAYCRRFANNLKGKGLDKRVGFLTTQELTDVLNNCIRQCQMEHFWEELAAVKKNEDLSKRSDTRTYARSIRVTCQRER